MRVSTSGKIVVYTGATPQGQSHKTTLAQIAAEQLGVDYNDVTVVTADTATISLGMGSFAARTAVNAGSSGASRRRRGRAKGEEARRRDDGVRRGRPGARAAATCG